MSQKNPAKLFLSELCQICTNFNNFWQKDDKEAEINTVVWWHELDEVESECITHNFGLFAIFLPKIIKIGVNLTKF